MPAPEKQNQSLADARLKTFAETNAQGVFGNLRDLRAASATHRRRWVWELLQNAADAASPVSGKNRVRIDLEQGKVKFRHDGAAFNSEQITHLIYHGSTKQGDDNHEIRFGTGFLTIHLVSSKVRVKGIWEDSGDRKAFEFLLDRGGDNPQAVQKQMDAAWDDFTKSLGGSADQTDFTTTFECDLDSESGTAVEDGLNDLARTIPYVLAFVEALEEVTVCSPEGLFSWTRSQVLKQDGYTYTDIVEKGPSREEIVRVVLVGNHSDSVAIAALLRQTSQQWEVTIDMDACVALEPLDFEDLPLGFGLGAGREVFTDAFAVQPAGDAENDLPGGIREL